MSRKKVTFGIGDTATICGVTKRALRRWAERKYIPEPLRIISGERAYRRYSQQDIEIIRKVKGFLDDGYKLSFASKLALKEFTNQNPERKEV